MIPVFDNGVVRLYQGDARRVLAELPAESAHCVVTSPPYWGLRDYGLEPLVWGDDEGHEHAWDEESYQRRSNDGGKTAKQLSNAGANGRDEPVHHGSCSCGAWRGSLGLEPTIDLYVQHIVEVFREVRRVLRKDGTLWLNMGDSYAADTKWGGRSGGLNLAEGGKNRDRLSSGLKPKDLCMMPARVALALQVHGWWVRSDIVWSKPNPMPESVTDRPTRSHEYLFLLTKAERYYYDADAIREQGVYTAEEVRRQSEAHKRQAEKRRDGLSAIADMGRILQESRVEPYGSGYRNKRSVWEIATEPYPEAHFATFPQKLVEPCILAATSERGVCPDCGAPWERVVERTPMEIDRSNNHPPELRTRTSGTMMKPATATTTGWHPTCDCDREEMVPPTVLDPFAGSGTVAYVAQRLGRRAIGIDLSADYLALAEKRMRGQTLPMGMG